jgi:hypothetical protein
MKAIISVDSIVLLQFNLNINIRPSSVLFYQTVHCIKNMNRGVIALARELGKYKLDLVRVQGIRWEKGGTERAEDYTFFCGQGKGDHQLGTGFFVRKRIVSAVRRVEIISDRMSCIILRGRWCNIIVLNVHAPCEDKGDDVKDSFCEEMGRVLGQFPRYDMKILVGVKAGRENIFKPTIGNESLHEINNDSGVRVVNFATSNNFVVKSTMFPRRKTHKYTWTSPEGNTHNQIDHVLIDRRRHSSILGVRSFRGADCDTDHYLVVAEVRERLAVSKRAAQKVDTERFNVKKLNEGNIKEQYRVTIRNKFAALENLEDSGDINGAWDNIRENIKFSAQESLGYCESKHRKPWCDEECSELVNGRKRAKLLWLQDPSEANEDNLSNVRREDSRHFGIKKREYLKEN